MQRDIHYGVRVSFSSSLLENLPLRMFVPDQSRAILMDEIAEPQCQYSRRHPICRSSYIRHLAVNPSTSNVYGGQRRHVSGAPNVVPLRDPPSHDPIASLSNITSVPDHNTVIVQRFQVMLQNAVESLDVEAVWHAYSSVVDCGAASSLSVATLLSFSEKLTEAVELHYQRNTDLETLHKWGGRIENLLQSFNSHIAAASTFDLQWHCLIARTAALKGDLQQAISLFHAADNIPSVYEDKGVILRVFQAILLSTWLHHNSIHALKLIMDEWLLVGSHLTGMSGRYHHASPAVMGRSLRQTAHVILAEIEHPATVLTSKRNWTNEHLQNMGNFLIEVYCDQRLPTDALEVLTEMKRLGLSTPIGTQLVLVRELVREDHFEEANTLYSSIEGRESMFRFHMATGLYLHAHQGNVDQAQKYYNNLVDRQWATPTDAAMLLYSHATLGKTEEVIALFNDMFPEGPSGNRLNSPSQLHYSIIVYAFSHKADFPAMNNWLQIMSDAGFAPDVYIFTNILKSFALQDDINSIVAVLNQMGEAGIRANYVTYTTVITFLARRRDPAGAEAVYKRAIAEGVVPDRRMITCLMNAHVAAGSWKGVIRVFDYIKSSPNIRLTLEVYNTLLKAYVCIGAPFNIVSKLFARLEASKIKPDVYTFSLLIQSACDAGHMRIASDIYHEMLERGSELLVNVYALTIIMAGFLRTGDKVRAKAAYDEMQSRGVQPSSITFRHILRAYGNERTEESIQIAEQFIQSLMGAPAESQAWATPPRGRISALGHIYGPLLNAYAKQQQPEQVERLFQELLKAGQKPTLGTLSMLLDAYRRTFNIEAVQNLWPQILELGLRYSSEGSIFHDDVNDPTRRRLQGNILCVPLSIYIDALSAAGLHLEIAAIWKEFQRLGFSFDSHNWNHLTVALVRAGEPERAFEVVEKIILPYQRESERVRKERDRKPLTPLTSETPQPSSDDGESETPLELRFRGAAVPLSVRASTARMGLIELVMDEEEHADDFAHPLHVLHQISPSWSTWKIHRATLSVLLMVASRLESGALIEPVASNNVMDDSQPVDIEKALKARQILNQIYKNYPNTVQAIMDFEVTEKRRLADGYDKMYKWQ